MRLQIATKWMPPSNFSNVVLEAMGACISLEHVKSDFQNDVIFYDSNEMQWDAAMWFSLID